MFASLASANGDGEGKDIGEASNMSQCTPLDFMSNFSAKSSDTLNYLIGEDEIEGDVGQEGEQLCRNHILIISFVCVHQ